MKLKRFKEINESSGRILYGEEVHAAHDNLKPGEDIYYLESSGDERIKGVVVTHPEYAMRMLKDAEEKRDWSKVNFAIMYIQKHLIPGYNDRFRVNK